MVSPRWVAMEEHTWMLRRRSAGRWFTRGRVAPQGLGHGTRGRGELVSSLTWPRDRGHRDGCDAGRRQRPSLLLPTCGCAAQPGWPTARASIPPKPTRIRPPVGRGCSPRSLLRSSPGPIQPPTTLSLTYSIHCK